LRLLRTELIHASPPSALGPVRGAVLEQLIRCERVSWSHDWPLAGCLSPSNFKHRLPACGDSNQAYRRSQLGPLLEVGATRIRAPTTPREGALSPRALDSVALGEDLGYLPRA
jgi:hypothetical protein